jgi:hypothetical protein
MSGELLDIEPDDIEIELEPEPEPVQTSESLPAPSAPVAAHALMQVLPADFPLPLLTRFVPDQALRLAADEAATYALSVEVAGPEGLTRADVAVTTLRASLKAIEDSFEEPVAIANRLHKQLTGVRAEWLERGLAAVKTVGNRIYTEKQRLDAIEREARRKAQEEADRKAREDARKAAEDAAKAQVPAPVVEEMRRQAAVVTAPPVPVSAPVPKLAGSSVVATWKARLAGTPACDEPNPDIPLTAAQRLAFFHLVVNVAAQLARELNLTLEPEYLTKCQGAPSASLAISWSYLNKRAKADKGTLQIPGVEAFEEGGIRSKGVRGK